MASPAVPRVRADLQSAFDAEWRRLGRPGTWWTATERVALASEARAAAACGLCAARKAAVSPFAVDGDHDATPAGTVALPAAAIEGVHRLASDPGRIGRKWSDALFDGGLSEEQVVELIGVVATVTAVDTFERAIGREHRELPQAEGGEPSRTRPPRWSRASARLAGVEPADAEGDLAAYYARAASPRGVPNIMKALSLVPAEHLGFFDVLFPAMYVPAEKLFDFTTGIRAISRPEVELLAATVSAANDCFY